VLATLTMVAEEREPLPTMFRRALRFESSIRLSGSAFVPRALRTRGASPP
jgi:hypothetical protein